MIIRAAGVSLNMVMMAVGQSNLNVGGKTIEQVGLLALFTHRQRNCDGILLDRLVCGLASDAGTDGGHEHARRGDGAVMISRRIEATSEDGDSHGWILALRWLGSKRNE